MRSGVLAGVVLIVVCLLVAMPWVASAHHAQHHFLRSYEASSAYVWGGPGQGGGFVGFAVCNNDQNTFADTAACVRYNSPVQDYRGWDFEVTLTDAVFGSQTRFLVGIDLTGNNDVDCTGQGGGPDLCFFGQGTVTGTVPATAQGHVMRVHPATVHNAALLCCPTSFATQGTIEITFSQ